MGGGQVGRWARLEEAAYVGPPRETPAGATETAATRLCQGGGRGRGRGGAGGSRSGWGQRSSISLALGASLLISLLSGASLFFFVAKDFPELKINFFLEHQTLVKGQRGVGVHSAGGCLSAVDEEGAGCCPSL